MGGLEKVDAAISEQMVFALGWSLMPGQESCVHHAAKGLQRTEDWSSLGVENLTTE